MAKFKFYLKDPKTEKTTSIMLVCQWSNQQVKVYTGKTIATGMWNIKEGRARQLQDFPEGRKLNAFLASKEQEAKNTYWDLELQLKRPPSKAEYNEALQSVLKTGKLPPDKLSMTYEEFVKKECEIMLASSRSQGTSTKISSNVQGHYDTLMVLRKYTGSGKPLRFEDFTMDFYRDFMHFCTFHRKYRPNTIAAWLRKIKTMMNRALVHTPVKLTPSRRCKLTP